MDYFDILFAKTNGVSSSSCYNETEAMLKATVGHSSKNLYQITVDTQTINGVTFNVDKVNGTITANGTSPSSKEATLTQTVIVTKNLAGKKYFSVSLNQVGSSSTFDAYIYDSTAKRLITKWDGTTTPRLHGTESQEVLLIEGHQLAINCRIFKGQNVSDLIYKPMLRDGVIVDDTFEPYVTPTDEKKQDKIKTIYVAPSLEAATDEIIIPRSNDINFFIVVCLADGDTDKAVTFIVPQELFGLPCVNGDFSITGSVVDETHNKLTFGFPNTFSEGKIIRVLGIPNISY